MVDDAVPFRRIDGNDGIHGGINLMRIAFSTRDGRVHERHGIMGARRRIRANVGRYDDVALEDVAERMHAGKLRRNRNG